LYPKVREIFLENKSAKMFVKKGGNYGLKGIKMNICSGAINPAASE